MKGKKFEVFSQKHVKEEDENIIIISYNNKNKWERKKI